MVAYVTNVKYDLLLHWPLPGVNGYRLCVAITEFYGSNTIGLNYYIDVCMLIVCINCKQS